MRRHVQPCLEAQERHFQHLLWQHHFLITQIWHVIVCLFVLLFSLYSFLKLTYFGDTFKWDTLYLYQCIYFTVIVLNSKEFWISFSESNHQSVDPIYQLLKQAGDLGGNPRRSDKEKDYHGSNSSSLTSLQHNHRWPRSNASSSASSSSSYLLQVSGGQDQASTSGE